MTSAEPHDGDHVTVEARYEGHTQHGEAWFRTEDAAKRVEWGAEGQPYNGWMQVEPDDDGSRLTVHVTTGRLTDEYLGEVKAYTASAIE